MIGFWPIVLTVSGLAASSQFARAVRGHFVSERLPPQMKLLAALSYLAMFVYLFALWTGTASAWQRVAGLLLQVVAAALFNWARTTTLDSRLTAAFDTDQPQFLMKAGPYQFVRHPFYASYIAFWVGSSLAANSLVLWLICLALITIYIFAARLEERKFEVSPFAADYRVYSRSVGFLIPKLATLSRRDRLEDRPHP